MGPKIEMTCCRKVHYDTIRQSDTPILRPPTPIRLGREQNQVAYPVASVSLLRAILPQLVKWWSLPEWARTQVSILRNLSRYFGGTIVARAMINSGASP